MYGKTAAALVARKAIAVSIGYKAIQPRCTDQGRELVECDLREVSLVTLPMCDGTEVWAAPANGKIGEKALAAELQTLGAINLALSTAAARLALAVQ
jgi:phage head maturation protease